jgi:hypothetical protein
LEPELLPEDLSAIENREVKDESLNDEKIQLAEFDDPADNLDLSDIQGTGI